MKANELMIGDWLHLHYCNKFEGEVHKNFRVWQIRNDYGEICVWAIKDGSGIYGNMGELEPRYGETNISPIPLTPEILEKNGFKQEDGIDSRWYHAKMGRMLITLYRSDTFYSIMINTDHHLPVLNNIQLHSVHELQHALRLCGIEKEIVL